MLLGGTIMLVLSRKKNESVILGDKIRVVVLDVRGDKVQLGIEAPSDVLVYRSEVFDRIRQRSEKSKKDEEENTIVTLDFSREEVVLKTKPSASADRESDETYCESNESRR